MTSIISPLSEITGTSKSSVAIPSSNVAIPIHKIDLSLPPSQRYVALGTAFAPQMRAITPLFDDVLHPAFPQPWIQTWIKILAWLFLRRLYSAEETEEIKGIARASGVDVYILVALNVLLDSMLGCTSGAVMTTPQEASKRRGKASVGIEEKGVNGGEKRMMHFRTLDWGMDPLRSVLVLLEFVKSDSEEPEKVIARTITYTGFVGALTGVRKNLSVSLNFRPNHDCSTRSLRLHQLAILLGFRPSIAHILREALFPPSAAESPSLDALATKLSTEKTAPCYLILCDGNTANVLEKDLVTARIRTSDEFIIHTNNDTLPSPIAAPTPVPVPVKSKTSPRIKSPLSQPPVTELIGYPGMASFLADSRQRSACVQKKWNDLKGRQRRKQQADLIQEKDIVGPSVREETLVGWVRKHPTMNEQSHFGCVMDPKKGEVKWIERGEYWDSDGEEGEGEEVGVSD